MSCIETFIPRTKLENKLAKEFGLNNHERDTILAIAKSNAFKEWYQKNYGVPFDEEGDGRKIYPAVRRYYNNKFFSVNANTTIKDNRGRFTSLNARTLAIDHIVGEFYDVFSSATRLIDENETTFDEEGNEIPNPNCGKTIIRRYRNRDAIAWKVRERIIFAAKDATTSIIASTLPENVKNDFYLLNEMEDNEEENTQEYLDLIEKYQNENTTDVTIRDSYDLASVFSNDDFIVKTLRDRIVKKSFEPEFIFTLEGDIIPLSAKILSNDRIATVQDRNKYALLMEVKDGIDSDFFNEVYANKNMNFINRMHEKDEIEYDEDDDPENPSGEESDGGRESSEERDTVDTSNIKMGSFDDFMKHVDSAIKSYLGSLKNITDANDTSSYDTNNELGVATRMNVNEICQVLYQYAAKYSPEAFLDSISRIARDVPGMKGLAKIVEDCKDGLAGLDLHMALYSTFAKLSFTRSSVNYDGSISEVRISNEQGIKINALRMHLLNEFRGTGLSMDYNATGETMNNILEKIKKYKGSEAERIDIVKELNDILSYVLPTLANGTVTSYILKDGVDNFKFNATNLLNRINAVLLNIEKLQNDYNSLRDKQNEVFREINSINYSLTNSTTLSDKEYKALFDRRRELRDKLKKLYSEDYTQSVQSSLFTLAQEVVDYTLVRTDTNSPNIHGDMSSNVLNNNMISNILNTIKNSDALKNYGKNKFRSQQYKYSNILVEKVDANGNIISHGLFREVEVEVIDEETGEITVKKDYEPTEYAADLINFELFDGVKNTVSGNAALYSEMTKIDYTITAFNEYFKDIPVPGFENIHTANYFTRIPSDAPKTFVCRAPKLDIKGFSVGGKINRNHAIFLNTRDLFYQEIQDALNAVTKFFVVKNGVIQMDTVREITDANGNNVPNPNYGKPLFKEGWSNNTNDARRAFDVYHTQTDKKGNTYFYKTIKEGTGERYELVGRIFNSDKFVISTTQKNYGKEFFDKYLNFLYGAVGENSFDSPNVFDSFTENENGTVDYKFTKEVQDALDDMIANFISDYVKDSIDRVNKLGEIPSEHNNPQDIADFALNTFLMYNNFNDLLEGDTKFYKDAQTFLKRAKEMQASGIPYGLVNYATRAIPDLSHITSRLDSANIMIGNKKITLRNGFTGVTIKNTIRTSEEAIRLFGHEEEYTDAYGKKQTRWIKGSLQERGILDRNDDDTAKRLKKLYSYTKTNDAQSYITLDEWIRRITARGQYARYESLIKKLVDPNAVLTEAEVDDFVQVQKNFYYDQHYNEELGVHHPRQIKNAEFVLIPKFIQGSDLETVYNLMKEYDIDQLNTAETSKAGKANVLTLWNNDGQMTDETIADFRAAMDKNKDVAIEKFSYNNLYIQQDVPQHMDSENKAGIQIMKKILDNIQETYNGKGEPTGLYKKKVELMEAYTANIKESFKELMDKLDIPVNDKGYPELEFVNGRWQIKGLSYEKLFERLKEEANRTGVNSNVAEFFELDKHGNPLMPPFMGNVSSKLESIIQSLFNSNVTRQKLPGFHAAQVTGVGISGKLKLSKGTKNETIKTSNELRYHPVGPNGDIEAYAEVIIPIPERYAKKFDELRKTMSEDDAKAEILKLMEKDGTDTFIGYRIPTEGKQSVSVMKAVGLLSRSQGSTIIVPDDWVSQTGADFDVDSIYAICMEPDDDGKVRFGMDTRRHRNNLIVKNMIDILSDPRSVEENLSCSNFIDIIEAREEVLEGTDVAKQKNSRSPYNFFDQADYQEDAMSGARLKGMSVTRDTMCSVCNTVRPLSTRPMIVRYSEYDAKNNPNGVKEKDIIAAYGKEGIGYKIIKTDKGRVFEVKHNRFGWSENNKNVKGRLITAYSSQTTAHILDAVKEGNIPNVNELTFGIYKMFPDMGIDYRTAVSFMMTPGVSRIVNIYNANKSIYADSNPNRKNDNRQFIIDAVKEIAAELNLVVDGQKVSEFTPYKKVLAALDARYGQVIKDLFDIEFSFSYNSKTDGNIRFSAETQIDRIKNRGIFKSSPVEESINVGTYSGQITADDPAIFVFGSNYASYNGNPARGTGGAALVALQQGRIEQREYLGNKLSNSGRAYGIATVTAPGAKNSLTDAQIIENIRKFYNFALANPNKTFKVAYQETGRVNLNGRSTAKMIELFRIAGNINNSGIPSNVLFSDTVRNYFINSLTLNTLPVAQGNMTFAYENNKRNDVKSATTFEAILNGERKATTRYESDGHIDYWKNLKAGDIVEFTDGNNNSVFVRITKPLTKLDNNTSAEEWSKKEGWSTAYFESKVKPHIENDGAWQMEYELVDSYLPNYTSKNDPETTKKLYDLLTVFQYQYLANTAQSVGDYARVLNPDKFGAKVTTYSTRKTISDVRRLVDQKRPVLIVPGKITGKDIDNFINYYNENNVEFFDEEDERFLTAKESQGVLNSDKTILSNDELTYWNNKGLGNSPRILVASERTDPAFHTEEILEVLGGSRSVKQWGVVNGKRQVIGELAGQDFNGLYIITKHDGLPIRQLLSTGIPKLIHFSITGLGGTKYEPGVMKYNDLLDRIQELIQQGLDPESVTVRIDPIIPGVTTFEDIENIIKRSSEMGIKRIRFSILDGYASTIKHMTELGYDFEKYYGSKNGHTNFHVKKEFADEIINKLIEFKDKYEVTLGTCAEPYARDGISKEGCLSVNAVNAMLGTSIEDKGTENNTQRQLCSCFGGKVDALDYNSNECNSHCVYCYAKHDNDTTLQYYNEDGTLKDNPYTRTTPKRYGHETLDINNLETRKDIRNRMPKVATKNIIESIYPGIEGYSIDIDDFKTDDGEYDFDAYAEAVAQEQVSNEWVYSYLNSTEESSYPSLNAFFKYATLFSTFVEEQVFVTESDEFRKSINHLSKVLGRNITEAEYTDFKRYYLNKIYRYTYFDQGDNLEGNIAQNDSFSRITGINMPIQFNFKVVDITNPTDEEKEAFRNLTPAQKVLWIKQNSRDAGIFKYLDVNLRNASIAENYSSTQQITFNADSVDEEVALADMRKAWNNKIWFVKETVRDLFKYAIVVENYKLTKRGITRLIVNDILRDTNFTKDITSIVEEACFLPSDESYVNYVRSHADKLGIPTFDTKGMLTPNEAYYDVLVINLASRSDPGFKYKIVKETRGGFNYNPFIRITDKTGKVVLMRANLVGSKLIYTPLNNLMPNENSTWSVKESENYYARDEFYREYIAYIERRVNSEEGVSERFEKNVNDYKYKSTKKDFVVDIDIEELANSFIGIKQFKQTIDNVLDYVDTNGYYIRNNKLSELRPSVEEGNPNSYFEYHAPNGKTYTVKHMDGKAKIGQFSINDYLVQAKGMIYEQKESNTFYGNEHVAKYILNNVVETSDPTLRTIIYNSIMNGSSSVSDLFVVFPKKTTTAMASATLEDIVPEAVVGMSNRRAIGDRESARTLYEMDQHGINPESIDDIRNNMLPSVKYINKYVKLTAESLIKQCNEFYQDSNNIAHSVTDPDFLTWLGEHPKDFNKLLNLYADIKNFISEMNFIAKNNFDTDTTNDEIKKELNEIKIMIDNLSRNDIINKMNDIILEYLKYQSDDPLIYNELYDLTSGFHNIGKVESLFTDAQEAPVPLMQVILHIATSRVRGDDMKHFKNAKKFRNKIDALLATGNLDLNKIIDDNGRLIQLYNQKLIEDYEKWKEKLSNILKNNPDAENSVEYIKTFHEYKKWKLANFHQRIVDSYYQEIIDAEEEIMDPNNGFIDVYRDYVQLTNERKDILSSSIDGSLTDSQKSRLKDIQESIDLMCSTYDREHIYDLVDPYLPRSSYTNNMWLLVNTSYEAAEALSKYIATLSRIKEFYFNKNEKEAFRKTLEDKLKIIFDAEDPDPNTGDPRTPSSQLLNNKEYQDAKDWIAINARLTTTPQFKQMLERAYKELGVGNKGKSFKFYEIVKSLGSKARDKMGVVDGTQFTDKDIDDLKQAQLDEYQTQKLAGYDWGHLIQNGNPSPFVWDTSFWLNMTVTGTSNGYYILLVNQINNILNKVYDSDTKKVNISKIDIEGNRVLSNNELTELVRLYDLLYKTQKHFDTDNGNVVHDWMRDNVELAYDYVRFNEEQNHAEAVYGKNTIEYKLWERINTQIIMENGIPKSVPNQFLYGNIKPKNALGVLNRNADGEITSITGNPSFMKWINVSKTKANDTIKRFVSKTPTRYYYDTKAEVYKRQGTESDAERQKRINEWYSRNHIYNPYTHEMEPLQCWLMTKYKGGNISLAAATGTSPGIYSYEPNFAQVESELKCGKNGDPDYRNHDYVEDNLYKNYKGNTTKYNNKDIKKLTKEEKEARNLIEQSIDAYATSASAKRYVQDGSLPAERKSETSHSFGWHVKKGLQSFGWYYMPHDPGLWQRDMDFEHDYVPTTYGLKQLGNKETKKKENLPKRSAFKNTPEGQKEYEKKKAEVEKLNKQIEEDNRAIHKQLLDRDWIGIMERFIVNAGHQNSVQENKNLIYFGLDYMRKHKVYATSFGTGKLHKDKHSSFGNNENYEKEGYGDDTLAVYEAWARRFIFNQFKKDQGAFTKVANLLQQMSSAKYMMVNITGGISNVLMGESQIAMEAFANEYFNAKEWGVGKQLWIQSINSFGHHLYNDEADEIGDALCKWFNTLDFDSITELHEDNPNAAVKWKRIRNFTYGLQTMGEHFMQNGALLTMLSSHRLVKINDRLSGAERYVAWSYDRYMRDVREQVLKSVIKKMDKYNDFVKQIKDNPNDTKDYAWRKKDLITEYVRLNLNKEQQKQFIEKKKELEKKAEEEFNKLPTMFDQFELKDGYAEFKQGSKKDGIILSNLTEEEAYRILGEMKNKVIAANKKIHGVYDKLGASRLEQEWYGGLIMQYHKHIWPGIMKRWRSQGYYNEDRQTTEKGSYQSLLQFLAIPYRNMKNMPESSKDVMTGIQNYFKAAGEFLLNLKLNYNLLSNTDQANIRRTLVEICSYMSAVAFSVALKLAADDDDKSGIPYNMAIYLVDRFASETRMYEPFGAWGEAKKLWSSPVAAQTNISDILESINVLSDLIIQGDDFDPTYKSGLYAGQNKLKILITRNIPIVRTFQQIWRLPKNNKYYKRQSNGVTEWSDRIVSLIQND